MDTTGSTPPPNGFEHAVRHEEVAALDRLTRMGGETLVRELAFLYLDQMPERLLAARAAMRDSDMPALANAVHAMRSSSAQLGARALADACDAAETAADGHDVQRARAHLERIESEYGAFSAWLAARTEPERSGDHKRSSEGGPVIALIEDNADNRLLVDAILGDTFVLDEYAAGAEAIEGMRVRRPDLVLLDVSLPGMDGLEVLARIHRDPALDGVPVVALTAHAMAGDRERYLTAGFDEYVAKPIVDDQELIRVIGRCLIRSGALPPRGARARADQ